MSELTIYDTISLEMGKENKEALSPLLWINRVYAGGMGAAIGTTLHSASKEELPPRLAALGVLALLGALQAGSVSAALKDGDKRDQPSSDK